MMRHKDFGAFILTHGRADRVYTVDTLKQSGYTGPLVFVIDDEDDQRQLYFDKFVLKERSREDLRRRG